MEYWQVVGTKKKGKLQIYKLEKVMKDLDDFYLWVLLLLFWNAAK